MRRRVALLLACILLAAAALGALANPPAAQAGILGSLGATACKVVGTIGEGWMGTACNAAVGIGQKLAGAGGKAATIVGKLAGNSLLRRAAGIAAIVAWVLGGAKWTIDHMASVISQTTSPQLTSGWFTGVYLRVEGIAVFFTLLFVFAAAIEALLRSEPVLLARAVFGYLPLAALATAVATPLTMLLLAATDQLSTGFANLAGQGSTHFLTGTSAWVIAGLTAANPFFAVMAAGLVVAAGGALWVEMLIREVAVYVVVAMLPLAFAAIVWPARRIWAARTVEVLLALILAKVAIVVVLALGAGALAHATAGGLTRLLGGLALIVLGAFSPWVLLRLIPMAEVAAAAVGHIRGHVHASAGIRTPEAVLASAATGRARQNRRNGTAGDAGDALMSGLAVGELLEQMQRRAHAAEQPPVTAPTPQAHGTSSAGVSLDPDPPNPDAGDPSAAPRPVSQPDSRHPNGTAAPTPVEPETMAQRPDGSWEPLAHSDPDEPISPAPWDESEHDQPAADDRDAPAPAPPRPEPQDGRLSGDQEDPQ
ncbi:MAG: hypothetical protein ACRDL5_14125 [Solirubrobacteraceae bacterium]